MTPYDVHTLVRSLLLGSTLCLLTFVVMVASDGGHTTVAQKIGQLCVLAPLLAALGARIAMMQAQSRGETKALESLGASPSRVGLGASLAVVVLGAMATAALAARVGDIEGLLPRLDGVSWTQLPEGVWISTDSSMKVDAQGLPSFGSFDRQTESISRSTTPFFGVVAAMTVALSDWSRERIGTWSRMMTVLVGSGLAILVFHLVAADRASPWLLLVVPLPIIAQTWFIRLYRWATLGR